MKGLLNECLPQAQYSAISSTVTLSDDIFKNILCMKEKIDHASSKSTNSP